MSAVFLKRPLSQPPEVGVIWSAVTGPGDFITQGVTHLHVCVAYFVPVKSLTMTTLWSMLLIDPCCL